MFAKINILGTVPIEKNSKKIDFILPKIELFSDFMYL